MTAQVTLTVIHSPLCQPNNITALRLQEWGKRSWKTRHVQTASYPRRNEGYFQTWSNLVFLKIVKEPSRCINRPDVLTSLVTRQGICNELFIICFPYENSVMPGCDKQDHQNHKELRNCIPPEICMVFLRTTQWATAMIRDRCQQRQVEGSPFAS